MTFCLTIENKTPGFDASFESSVLSRAAEEINTIAEKLEIKDIYAFFNFEAQNELTPAEHRQKQVPWFEAQEGVEWMEAVIGYIEKTPTSVSDAIQVVEDLRLCQGILVKAGGIGARWHFWMDI